jgi:hypothetical protein
MKHRVEKVLVQLKMAEPTNSGDYYGEGTRWKDRERFLAILKSTAELWSHMQTIGPAPEVTISLEV